MDLLRAPWNIVPNNTYEDIKATAGVQLSSEPQKQLTSDDSQPEESLHDLESNHKRTKPPIFANLFDRVVTFAGTNLILFLMIAGLLGWMIIGIVLGPSQTWQIAIQNVSSIQCYVSDTLLMRQQRNNCRDLLSFSCELRSRNLTCRRILQRIRQVNPGHCGSEKQAPAEHKASTELNVYQIGDGVHLPPHSLYDRICDPVVWAFGSLYAPIIYWSGIFVWLGFGHHLQWGNTWQLYINTATAVELTFVSIFLQNTRQRHMDYLKECFKLIVDEGMRLERRLREISGDTEPNPTVEFEYDYPRETTRGNRIIDYYAAIVGTGVGLALSAIVFAVWIGIGHPMQWNSNWWLIIGTYTGLVGFIDGFVLRNVYFRGSAVVDAQFCVLAEEEDALLCEFLGAPVPAQDRAIVETGSLQGRIANKIGVWCSRSSAVLGAVVVVVAVLAIATGMWWSETGQLICNTPTMIVEGFLLMVLIQAHNTTNRQRRMEFRDVLRRRLEMNSQIERLVPHGGAKWM